MHLTDGQLLESLDTPEHVADDLTFQHLEACHECLARRTELKHEMAWAVDRLSVLAGRGAPPDADSILARVPRTSGHRFPYRTAAGIAFLLVAGTLSAMPASPIRRWIESSLGEMQSETPAEAAPQVPSNDGGLALTPGDALSIHIAGEALRGGLTVELGEGDLVRLETIGSVASFAVEAGNVVVTPAADSLELLVVLPIDLPELTIYVGSRRVLSKAEGQWSPSVNIAVVGDRERISLELDGP